MNHDPSYEQSLTLETTKKRSPVRLGLFLLLCLGLFCLFSKLALWQVARLEWKKALIAQVEDRIQKPLHNLPLKKEWPKINAQDHAYLPVTVMGHFLSNKEIFVTAVNGEDSGFWWMVPFKTKDGTIVFVNRGFLTQDQYLDKSYKTFSKNDFVKINGLLRLSEENGHFFRKNHPEKNQWYNRNVPEMAAVLKLRTSNLAPYFIDAFNIPGQKIGILGLTKINFPNNHLSYAITWSVLALFVMAASGYILFDYYKRPKK